MLITVPDELHAIHVTHEPVHAQHSKPLQAVRIEVGLSVVGEPVALTNSFVMYCERL